MLNISDYLTKTDAGITFSQEQANHFAKGVARDFNPIHDIGGKRFCVPGDLLFAALLDCYGVHQKIKVDLMALVNADVVIALPDTLSSSNEISDAGGRHLLTYDVAGENTNNADFVTSLVQQYVLFSGKTFPDILVGLMRDNNVMINPERPLVIYKDMSVTLDTFGGENLSLEEAGSTLSVDGKKGKACLRFNIKSHNNIIGYGEKNMLLSGLREFDESAMADIVAQYQAWRDAYQEPAT